MVFFEINKVTAFLFSCNSNVWSKSLLFSMIKDMSTDIQIAIDNSNGQFL